MRIYTLTLCPAYDVHAYADTFECGRENLITARTRDAGGKGVNISRALLSHGVSSIAIILCGNENSAEFEKQIKENGINADFIFTDGRIRENITVHTPRGETRISFAGASVKECAIEEVKQRLRIDNGDIVTFTGRIPDGISVASVKDLIKQIKMLKVFNRPIVCSEWLNRIAGNTVFDTFPLFYLEKIGCYNWGFVAGKYQTYEPWNFYWLLYDQNPNIDFDFTKWFHDLYRPNHRPYDPKEEKLIREFCKLADEDFVKEKK